MSISNIVQLTKNLPVYTEKLTFNEDEFNVTENQIVTISRLNGSNVLKQVDGVMSEGLKLKIHSEWKSLNDNSIFGAVYKIQETLSDSAQLGLTSTSAGGGLSFIQPWNNRKLWGGTQPFPLDFSMTFFSQDNSKTDVFDKVITLVSFCMPRKVNNVIGGVMKDLGGLIDYGGSTVSGEHKNLMTAFANAMETWSIPGPSLYFDGQSKNGDQAGKGDPTTIVIGNMFAFGGCYITDVSTEWSPTFDSSGYPIWCKVSVSAQAMDTNTVDANGTWDTRQYVDSQAGLSDFLGAAKETITTFISDFTNVIKKSIAAT